MRTYQYLTSFFAALLLVSTAYAATVTIRPNAQGNYAAWTATGCTQANGYQCVDEASSNTADFVQTSTNGAKETFLFGSTGITAGDTIASVTLNFLAEQVKNPNKCFAAMVRIGGVDFLSGTQICTTGSWVNYTQTYAVNPSTNSSWNVSDVNALEAGMYGLNPSAGAKVAQVSATVSYNPVCGNNVKESGEACDGTDLSGQTCGSQGFDGGTLSCASDCSGFVTTSCFTNSCSDTDGFNILTQGTVNGTASGSPYSFTDFCVNMTTVQEYFCSSHTANSFVTGCNGTNMTGVCNAGACS